MFALNSMTWQLIPVHNLCVVNFPKKKIIAMKKPLKILCECINRISLCHKSGGIKFSFLKVKPESKVCIYYKQKLLASTVHVQSTISILL
jgi:hypothetical protein